MISPQACTATACSLGLIATREQGKDQIMNLMACHAAATPGMQCNKCLRAKFQGIFCIKNPAGFRLDMQAAAA